MPIEPNGHVLCSLRIPVRVRCALISCHELGLEDETTGGVEILRQKLNKLRESVLTLHGLLAHRLYATRLDAIFLLREEHDVHLAHPFCRRRTWINAVAARLVAVPQETT